MGRATWAERVISYLIDFAPVAVIDLVGWFLFAPKVVDVASETGVFTRVQGQLNAMFWVFLGFAVLYWLWNRVYLMGTTGSSLGMRVVGTTAVGERTGQPLGAGLNFLRQILLLVDFWICYVGVLWPLWDAKKQCLLSDKASHAIVVKA